MMECRRKALRTTRHAPARAIAQPVDLASDMTRLAVYVAGLALLLLMAMAATAHARSMPDSFADLVETLNPTVVNISSSQTIETPEGRPENPFPPGSPFEEFFKDFFDRNRPPGDDNGGGQQHKRRATSLGSGFIIDSKGIIVTNNHVIDGADEITVILQDGDRMDAELIGKDPKIDLAVLRVKPDKPLPAAKWGRSEQARVGDWVIAIGNPFGLGGTVTAGIISARGRDINAGPYDSFIQTDAAINKGNSGGPLFNLQGEVIGINTAIISPSGGSSGIGFSVPSQMAKRVIDQLIKYGHTRRGWLGVRIQSVTDEIAESLGLGKARGALVAGLTEDSPAAKAGIEAGDVIIAFDGKKITEMRSLPRIVAETEVGKTVDVEVWRKGKTLDLNVTLGELEKAEEEVASLGDNGSMPKAKERALSSLGLKLSAITPELRDKYKIKGDKGVVVTDVDDGGSAAEKGLRAGDVIIEVSQEEVKTPEEVAEKVAKVQEDDRKSVLLLVKRGEDLRFVALRLAENEK